MVATSNLLLIIVGSLLVTGCRDKNMRLFDPRSKPSHSMVLLFIHGLQLRRNGMHTRVPAVSMWHGLEIIRLCLVLVTI